MRGSIKTNAQVLTVLQYFYWHCSEGGHQCVAIIWDCRMYPYFVVHVMRSQIESLILHSTAAVSSRSAGKHMSLSSIAVNTAKTDAF